MPDPEAPCVPATHVLVVDDDEQISTLLARYLGGNGFRVTVVGDAAALRSAVGRGDVDLILLDLGLPDEDGLTLLRDFRQSWRRPVIVISGRGESVDRIVGLELGADDYLAKPFDLRELLARIRSVLRRAPVETIPAGESAKSVEFDGLKLDIAARRLLDRSGQEVVLTTGEFKMLQALISRPHEVLTRDYLMNCMHGRDAGPFDRSIDVQMNRLRRKLEVDPAQPQLIKAVRGAGYLFTASVRAC